MEILISPEMDKILTHLVKENSREFTLFGRTTIVGQDVRLEEVRVPHQQSSGSYTEADINKFVEELDDEGLDPTNWNMWIHSHNTMGAFWSGTDREQHWDFDKGNVQHFWHMVMSTSGRKGCYTAYKPFKLSLDDLVVRVEEAENPEIVELLRQKKEIEDRIKEIQEVLPPMADILQDLIEERNGHFSYSKNEKKWDDEWNTCTHGRYKKFCKECKELDKEIEKELNDPTYEFIDEINAKFYQDQIEIER